MAAMSKYLADAVLNWLRGTAMPTAPTNLYAALYTAAPGNGNASGTEVTGGGYARVAVPVANISAPTSPSGTVEQIATSAAITFPTATANWGTIGWIAFYDAATGGNELLYGPLTSSVAVNTSNVFSLPSGQITDQLG